MLVQKMELMNTLELGVSVFGLMETLSGSWFLGCLVGVFVRLWICSSSSISAMFLL